MEQRINQPAHADHVSIVRDMIAHLASLDVLQQQYYRLRRELGHNAILDLDNRESPSAKAFELGATAFALMLLHEAEQNQDQSADHPKGMDANINLLIEQQKHTFQRLSNATIADIHQELKNIQSDLTHASEPTPKVAQRSKIHGALSSIAADIRAMGPKKFRAEIDSRSPGFLAKALTEIDKIFFKTTPASTNRQMTDGH